MFDELLKSPVYVFFQVLPIMQSALEFNTEHWFIKTIVLLLVLPILSYNLNVTYSAFQETFC